jgi:hypothetical protein
MLKYNLILLPVLAISLLPAGCGSPSVIKASPGQEFSLAISQQAELTGEDLTVTFNNVSEDSRCPKNVVCVWEGRAVCNLTVQKAGVTGELILTQPGLTASSTIQEYQGYQYSFSVEPYPEAGKSIAKSDYRLVMSISRK